VAKHAVFSFALCGGETPMSNLYFKFDWITVVPVLFFLKGPRVTMALSSAPRVSNYLAFILTRLGFFYFSSPTQGRGKIRLGFLYFSSPTQGRSSIYRVLRYLYHIHIISHFSENITLTPLHITLFVRLFLKKRRFFLLF